MILLGAPGSGKGTMAAELVQLYLIPHISTGDIFRKNIKEKTKLGLEAEQFIKQGFLVPDSLTIAMVADRLEQPDSKTGFLLDGFPRTLAQAEALAGILLKKEQPLNAVVNICIKDETVLDRLGNRRVCASCGRTYNTISMPPSTEGVCDTCGSPVVQREDDKPDTIRQRLQTYYRQTLPVADFYRRLDLLFDIENEGAPGDSLAAVKAELAKRN